MRSLTNTGLLKGSAPAGLILGAACAPLIIHETPQPLLRNLQLVTLPVLSGLLVQAAMAWTPEKMSPLAGDGARDAAQQLWVELLALAGIFTVFRCTVDPVVRRLFTVLPISSWSGFVRKLPFAVFAQPLFLIIGVYTFAYRLSCRARVALMAVVFFHQVIVVLQFAGSLDLTPLAAIAFIAGIDGLVGAVAYMRYGVTGPVVICFFAYARHAIYLGSG